MAKPKKKEPKPKPTPRSCFCGKLGILVSARGRGKMISCPDPMNCAGNFRTPWFRSELQAINYWNDVIITNGGKK